MAKSYLTVVVMGLSALLAGCQAKPRELMVDSLPPQNFSGPAPHRPTPIPAPPLPKPPVAPPPIARAPSVIVPAEWVPNAKPNAWRWIVIHHSATPTGGAASFGRMHQGKGWDELGYHFVIGNGTETRDGQVEVGTRWGKQKWGAHAKTANNEYNNFGIGICLVGNFDNTRPTNEQMRSLGRLVGYLMKTYNVPASRILGHGQTGKATDCPGRYLSIAEVQRQSGLAAGPSGPPARSAPVATSLLHPIPSR